jgi:hypothetical protein
MPFCGIFVRTSDERSRAMSVFPPATPADFFEDGPTERLASAGSSGPAEPAPRRGVVFAVLMALLSLLVSAGSGLIAWRALGRAEQAYHRAPPVSSAPVTTYADEALRVQGGCGTTTLVDLDEPRVNVPSAGADLRYQGACGQAVPQLALGAGALAGSRPGYADGCGEAVRSRPISHLATSPASKGLILCVLTRAVSPTAAGATGVRLVRVQVTEVTGDGTAYLRATSWPAAG